MMSSVVQGARQGQGWRGGRGTRGSKVDQSDQNEWVGVSQRPSVSERVLSVLEGSMVHDEHSGNRNFFGWACIPYVVHGGSTQHACTSASVGHPVNIN